jgi:hypothetical protein
VVDLVRAEVGIHLARAKFRIEQALRAEMRAELVRELAGAGRSGPEPGAGEPTIHVATGSGAVTTLRLTREDENRLTRQLDRLLARPEMRLEITSPWFRGRRGRKESHREIDACLPTVWFLRRGPFAKSTRAMRSITRLKQQLKAGAPVRTLIQYGDGRLPEVRLEPATWYRPVPGRLPGRPRKLTEAELEAEITDRLVRGRPASAAQLAQKRKVSRRTVQRRRAWRDRQSASPA